MWILKFSLSLLRTVDRAIDAHRPAPPAQGPSGAPAPEQERREHACTDAVAHRASRTGAANMPMTEADPEGRTASGTSDASARAEPSERLAGERRRPWWV